MIGFMLVTLQLTVSEFIPRSLKFSDLNENDRVSEKSYPPGGIALFCFKLTKNN
jgi:hypothetical protein